MAGTILESSKAANLHMPVKEKGGPSTAKQAQAADDWGELWFVIICDTEKNCNQLSLHSGGGITASYGYVGHAYT